MSNNEQNGRPARSLTESGIEETMKGLSGITLVPEGLDGCTHLLGCTHLMLIKVVHGSDLKTFPSHTHTH